MSTHIPASFRSRRRLARLPQLLSASGALLFASSCVAAPKVVASSAAPGAGGYNSDFGSDYGVGRARRAVGRQPIQVVGLRAKTRGGTLQPWVGLRFGDALSRSLAPFMGRASSASETARRLASSGVRAPDAGCPWPQANVRDGAWFRLAAADGGNRSGDATSRALLVLQGAQHRAGQVELIGTGAPSGRDSLVLFGDMTVDGPLERATSAVYITIRVVRSDASQLGRVEIVSPVITVQAAARDWAQLPSRTALAVLDALQISLKDSERVRLLRDASPLMPGASLARLALEKRLGSAMAGSLDARLSQARAKRATTLAARRQLMSQSIAQGTRALRELRALAKSPSLASSERASWSEITSSARAWAASSQADLAAARSAKS